jgi:hypothetical protein
MYVWRLILGANEAISLQMLIEPAYYATRETMVSRRLVFPEQRLHSHGVNGATNLLRQIPVRQ